MILFIHITTAEHVIPDEYVVFTRKDKKNDTQLSKY